MTERERKELEEKMLNSSMVYDGIILSVYKDEVLLPNGHTSWREHLRHTGAVAIIPITDEGMVVMERQYRYAINDVVSEIPAGKLDSREEEPLAAAKRELKEETGYTADSWVSLGEFIGAPAYSDEKITIYLARGLHAGERKLDEDEFLNLELRPLAELVEDVIAGRITDAKTQLAILKAERFLENEK